MEREEQTSPQTERNWTNLGLARDVLLDEAESMYWTALKLEIAGAACSLKTILSQDPPLEELSPGSSAFLPVEKLLSLRILPYIKAWWPFRDRNDGDEYDIEVLRKTFLGEGEYKGAKEHFALGHLEKPIEYRLARMIWCGLGILDIDKVVEYRNPQFPSLCGHPQLGVFEDHVKHLENGHMDVQFIFLTCNDCGVVLRQAYYECTKGCHHQDFEDTKEVFAVCARCYETTDHDFQHLSKRSIHHPFSEAVARELCQCPGIDNPLRVVIDYPDPERWEDVFDERVKQHRTIEGHTSACQFLAMESKRRAVIATVNENEDREYEKKLKAKLKAENRPYRFRSDKKVLKLFPDLVKSRLFPVGNAHISLMFGPLIIENGAEPEPEGVVISCRNPPNLGTPHTAIKGVRSVGADAHLTRVLSISGDKTRKLRATKFSVSTRRLNGSIKQCLGGIFSGHEPRWSNVETKIITEFLQLAQSYRPGLMHHYNKEQIKKLLEGCESIITLLKSIISPVLKRYLRLLLGKLWDPSVPLRWSRELNNCQAFCDRLILQPELATCFPSARPGSVEAASNLNYLLSFCSRMPSLSEGKGILSSRLNEYFSSFHQEYDIIASFEEMRESGPGDPLRCDGILGWDCNTTSCSISEHVWQHIYDSASILFFHILRKYESYTNENWPENTNQVPLQSLLSRRLNMRQWLRQRVAILQGIDVLLGLCGALSRTFSQMALQTYTVESDHIGPLKMHRQKRTKFVWGKWEPGSSDTIGRHGPESMAAYGNDDAIMFSLASP